MSSPETSRFMDTIAVGLPAFDKIVGGGLPKGSVTLLLGEAGSGYREFAHSALLSVLTGTDTELSKVAYVSTSRTADQIWREVAALMPGYDGRRVGEIQFCDLSAYYFRETIAPTEWVGGPDLVGLYRGRDAFKAIFDFVEQHGKGGIVLLDTLTDLVPGGDTEAFRDLVPFLRALQRFAAQHGSLVFALLPSGLFSPSQEAALQEAADGTLVFTWMNGPHGVKRRQLWVRDFRGLTPSLTEKNLTEFTAEITAGAGFGLKSLSRIG